MDISVKIAITAPDGVVHEHEISAFEKGFENAAEIGLSIEDSKALLLNLQQEIVAACQRRSAPTIPHVRVVKGGFGAKAVRLFNIEPSLAIPP